MLIDWLKKLSSQQRIFIGVIGVFALIAILILAGVLPGKRTGVSETTIIVWGIDDVSVWEDTLSEFSSVYAGVDVVYRRVDYRNYESDLLNAMAAGVGPDVFMFHNSWLPKHGGKTIRAPTEKMSKETFSRLFPQVAEEDLIVGGRIIALPLSIDTLAFVYNRDIFDRKGVVFPPKTWEEFSDSIPKLRELEDGEIKLAATSMGGTSKSIPHAADILSLLMLQEGSRMVDTNLNRAVLVGRDGERALAFYTSFAIPENKLFTWNDSLKQTLDAFSGGEVAMIFAYAEELEDIRRKNPFLDFKVEPIFQLDANAPVNYANYWALAVSSGSQVRDEAWDFVIFATTDKRSARSYFELTNRPPALRFLISSYLQDPNIGVFAQQALTAKSWWREDPREIEGIFDTMIMDVILGNKTVSQALRTADTAITRLMRR